MRSMAFFPGYLPPGIVYRHLNQLRCRAREVRESYGKTWESWVNMTFAQRTRFQEEFEPRVIRLSTQIYR